VVASLGMIPRPGSVRVPAVALQRFWTMVALCA
jgi:hypothetical protein